MTPIKALNKNHLQGLIQAHIDVHGYQCDLNHIDVRSVTNMSDLFSDGKFNGDISKWDVSNVKNMEYIFSNSQFNGDISEWDVSNVTIMNGMFTKCSFDGDISKWNTSNVIAMANMFRASSFRGNISSWDTSNVTNMTRMFHSSEFNGDLSRWNLNSLIECDDVFISYHDSPLGYLGAIRGLYSFPVVKYDVIKETLLLCNSLGMDELKTAMFLYQQVHQVEAEKKLYIQGFDF